MIMNMVSSSVLLFFMLSTYNCVADEYKPLDNLNVNNYEGRWYQVYKDLGDMTFQGFGTCAVADYKLQNDGIISVLNSQVNKDGTINQIAGTAFYDEGNSGGELTVNLDGVNMDAPYWVIELGPIINNEYQYSIVSDNLKFSLFVLARNVTDYYNSYDNDVKKSLEEFGFNTKINKPMKMDQSDCDYNYSYITSNKPKTMVYSKQSECDVADYLKNAGFTSSQIPTMVCISKYESSFNCDSTNKNTDGSTDYGLFQINSYYWCSGDPNSKYNECGASCSSLFDCQKNANCAHTVFKQQGYTAWYGYQYHKSECDNYKLNC